jgi:hypothetical protein
MKYETLEQIAESLINGNWSWVRPRFERMSKADLLTFRDILIDMQGVEKTNHDIDILLKN